MGLTQIDLSVKQSDRLEAPTKITSLLGISQSYSITFILYELSFLRLFLSLFTVYDVIIWKSSAVLGSQTLPFRCLAAIRKTSAMT